MHSAGIAWPIFGLLDNCPVNVISTCVRCKIVFAVVAFLVSVRHYACLFRFAIMNACFALMPRFHVDAADVFFGHNLCGSR